MKHIRELEAWSIPGQLLHADYSKNILQQELWKGGVPKDVFLGISAIPDATDCENLKSAMQAGEITEDSFNEFCLAHSFPASTQSAESSAKYLEYVRGRCLAWIHLPDDADTTLLLTIVTMLGERGHLVIDPESMTTLNSRLGVVG